MDVQRLERLALTGDMKAAHELARACKRGGTVLHDKVAWALASERLSVSRLFRELGAAASRVSHVKSLRGMSFSERVTWVTTHLRALNGRRTARTLPPEAVWRLMVALVDAPVGSFLSEDGGTVPSAYNYPAHTTIALAVRVPRGVAVSVALCDAHAATPGRAWAMLQPWRLETAGRRKALSERCLLWSKDKMFFSLAQVKRLRQLA